MQPFELLNWCPHPLSKHWCNSHFKNSSSNIFAHISLLLRLATTAGQPSGSSFEKHCQASLASLPPLRFQSSGVHLAAHCSMKAYLQVLLRLACCNQVAGGLGQVVAQWPPLPLCSHFVPLLFPLLDSWPHLVPPVLVAESCGRSPTCLPVHFLHWVWMPTCQSLSLKLGSSSGNGIPVKVCCMPLAKGFALQASPDHAGVRWQDAVVAVGYTKDWLSLTLELLCFLTFVLLECAPGLLAALPDLWLSVSIRWADLDCSRSSSRPNPHKTNML